MSPSPENGPAPAAMDHDLTAPVAYLDSSREAGPEYPPGTVFGSYRLVKLIGAGGMGQVFIAEHMRLGRQVALKVLRTEFSGNREAVKRFFAEAQAVNRINHENIIEVSDFIENPSGPSFCIMELLKGVDLRTLEDREGALPLARAASIAIQMCRGLGAAHDARIIHRDLKPDNIFLVERAGRPDFVKLLDFGVAKLMDATLDSASTFKSTAGIVVGTPQYMSPEQAMGEQVDHRSDIYSMGVILFEMVTGNLPFEARSAREIMAKHLMVAPPRPSRSRKVFEPLPPALEELILACLKKEPRDRPQTIKEIEHRLEEIRERLPQLASPISLRHRLRDRRVWLAGGGTALLVLAMFLVSRGANKAPVVRERVAEKAAAVDAVAVGDNPRTRVQMTFQSFPSGATVFRVGDPKPLGVTPFVADFGLSSRSEVFEFHLDGWKVGRQHVSLVASALVEASLIPAESEVAVGAGDKGRPRESIGSAGPVESAEPAIQDSSASARGARGEGNAGPRVTRKKTRGEPPAARPNPKLDHDTVMNPFE